MCTQHSIMYVPFTLLVYYKVLLVCYKVTDPTLIVLSVIMTLKINKNKYL